MLPGRFSGYLDRGDRPVEEFQDRSAEEAIAWGRERAAVVLIRTGESDYYSAGEHNPEQLPTWPPPGLSLRRRRVAGFEALDNTEDDPPVVWNVRVQADLPGAVDARPFHERVRTSPAVQNVQAPAPGYPPVSAAFLVQAATRDQAEAVADTVVDEAMREIRGSIAETEGCLTLDVEVYPHRPGESVTGPGVFS
jgi:hypothetical protein